MTNDIKTALQQAMKARRVRVPQLAAETGIPKDRIYKWFSEGSNPKANDVTVLDAWIAKKQMENPFEKIPQMENDSRDHVHYLEKHIALLEKIRTIEISLNTVEHNQKVMHQQTVLLLGLLARMLAPGDQEKLKAEIYKIDKITAASLEEV
jgi:predicted DNA-binding transcriptional regulator AlpA